MQLTESLARFVVETQYSDLPAKAVELARFALLDYTGVTLAAVEEPVRGIVLDFVREMGGTPTSTVIGAGLKSSPPQAALANGTLGHALDYDDINDTMPGHPSVAIMPAVLALAERQGSSGRDVILAYVVGFELAAKLAAGFGQDHYLKGWHSTATVCTLGAAAAGAKLLGLGVNETRMALGIAGSSAAGSRRNFGTMTKPFHAGNAARGGVVAALLAQKGMTANDCMLESPMGFVSLYSGDSSFDADRVLSTLGNPYDIVSPGLGFKWYPSCASTHFALEAVTKLLENQRFDADQIEAVDCGIYYRETQVLIHSRPKKGSEGKFSLEYCVSRLLVDGALKLSDFTDQRVLEPTIQALIPRVRMYVHPRFADKDCPMGAVVTVRTRDGREFESEALEAKGWPIKPMTRSELVAKFRDCAGLALAPMKVDEALALIEGLEDLPDIRTLMNVIG